MIKILCERKFRESVWCKQILGGMTGVLKKKRRKYTLIDRSDMLCPKAGDGIFLVGTDDKWINEKVKICNDFSVVPIVVCNQYGRIVKGVCHCVTVDIENAMKQLCDYLMSEGRKSAVFYGLNTSSASDRGRAACFGALWQTDVPIIENNGRSEDCFNELYESIDKYDAVICANDFVAILLVKKLLEVDRERLEKLRIISCAKIRLSSVFGEYIISQESDFSLLGEVSAEMYEFLVDKEFVSTVTLNIRCGEFVGDKKENSDEEITAYVSKDAFYEDEEILSALKIDNLLSTCKDEDIEILKRVCMGKTYTKIAEECYMSESNVKYHVKKYADTLELRGREELEEALRGYLIY